MIKSTVAVDKALFPFVKFVYSFVQINGDLLSIAMFMMVPEDRYSKFKKLSCVNSTSYC